MRRQRGKSKTSVVAVVRSEDVTKALDLKRTGATIREIAVALNRSVGWVHKAIADYVDEHPAHNLEAYRHEVRERHEAIIASHWDLRREPAHARAIQDSEKILIAVNGAAAPTQTEVRSLSVGVEATPEKARAVMRQLFGDVTPEEPFRGPKPDGSASGE